MNMFIHVSASFAELWRHLLGGFLQFHYAASGMHGHWSGLKILSTDKICPIWLRQKDRSFWANWAFGIFCPSKGIFES